MHGQQT